jgi:hypothetical protein
VKEKSLTMSETKEADATKVTTEAAAAVIETKEADATKDDTKDTTEAVADVANRLKFFFGDANVRQDFFIRKLLMKNDGEYPHQVNVAALLRFNTIKQYTTDPAVVVQAAKTLGDVLTVSTDEQAIGRVNVFTKDNMSDNLSLTLHISNLAVEEEKEGEEQKYAVTTDQIRELFTQYGALALVKFRFRRDNDSTNKKRHPLGSAFVEFKTVADCEKAMAETLTLKGTEKVEPTRKLTLAGKDLEVVLLKDKLEHKNKDKDNDKRGDNKKRDRDDDDEPANTFTLEWTPGLVIQLKGLSTDCDREAILDAVAKGLDITADQAKEKKIWVDFSRGQVDGAIRFKEAKDASEVCKKIASGELEVAAKKVEAATVLEGEEETNYWKEFIAFKNKQMQHRNDERKSKKGKRHHPRKH